MTETAPRPQAPTLRLLAHAGEPFASLHRSVVGKLPELPDLDLTRHDEALVHRARASWQERSRTEFRSMQVMLRFVTESVGTGDPLEVYAGAMERVIDEVRQIELCEALCRKLGIPATLPEPLTINEPDAFLKAPMPERALHTAIAMLLVSETLSTGFIADLVERCSEPAVRIVLEATIEDAETHDEFTMGYVREALKRFHPDTLPAWRGLVDRLLAPHRQMVEKMLADVPVEKRVLDAFPDTAEAALGIFSKERRALFFQRTLAERLEPRLRELSLLPE